MDVGAVFQRFFDVDLQRDGLASAHALVGGNDCTAVGIENTVTECVRREATKDHRVNRTDTRAGQHGVGRFGDHRHVQADTVTLADTARLQHVGQSADLVVQFAVADAGILARVVTFPDNGDLVAMLGQVAVNAVDADVELAVDKPGSLTFAQIAFVYLAPALVPGQKAFGLLGPELVGLLKRLPVHTLIGRVIQVGMRASGLGHLVVFDCVHGYSPLVIEFRQSLVSRP